MVVIMSKKKGCEELGYEMTTDCTIDRFPQVLKVRIQVISFIQELIYKYDDRGAVIPQKWAESGGHVIHLGT